MNEYSIMPEIHYGEIICWNERKVGTHRHEIFFGNPDRRLSIKYGLVVFLKPEFHNMSNAGVHYNHDFDTFLKQAAQKEAMEYYGWSMEDWLSKFGRNYL